MYTYLFTKAGENLKEVPWTAYPRPLLQRDSFLCLNGSWQFAVCDTDTPPAAFTENIVVPFCPQSLLSGICRTIETTQYLFYKRTFSLPDNFQKDRVLLHFGAVEQYCAVWVNGVFVGEHTGGYLPFSLDITDTLQAENTVLVRTYNPLDTKLPYGKNRVKRGGMWYTPVFGIWQTVWIESVPAQHITALNTVVNGNAVTIQASGVQNGTVTVNTPTGALSLPLTNGQATCLLDAPRLWSPEDPYLYTYTVQTDTDAVASYFAVRRLEVQTVNGIPRLCLNGKPYFFHGLLDQGYWSDGLYTPADPACFEEELLKLKKMGFNMVRKHIKIESQLFYYACDRLGIAVFQDMVNNGKYHFLLDTAFPTAFAKRLPDKWRHRDKETRKNFLAYMENTVSLLGEHPSIVYWTIFNEGWGQFDSEQAYHRLKALDATRFIDTASGWFKGATSDVESEHVYFKPFRLKPSPKPVVLSEFGGYSYKPQGHVFNTHDTYGYRFFADRAAFETALIHLYRKEVVPAVQKGLCAAVLTQVSDVEDETNGLFSYDRKITKVDPANMREIAYELSLDKP
ncbi:MAG: glycoside hydrolase family 2 [Clostridia bacterium]|nr:glycoside hydrolase family 2 [Clostridia bacterium]